MKFTEGKVGRVFVVHFDDGEEIPVGLEKFAADHGIAIGYVHFTGGLLGGEIQAGSEMPYARPFSPCRVVVKEACSVAAFGLIALDEQNAPRVTLSGAMGFQEKTLSGTLTPNLKIWNGGEAIVYEVIGVGAERTFTDGFATLKLSTPVAVKLHDMAELAAHVGDHTHCVNLFNATLS